jgi:hypothetical protein
MRHFGDVRRHLDGAMIKSSLDHFTALIDVLVSLMTRGVAVTRCNSLEQRENILQHVQHEKRSGFAFKCLILLAVPREPRDPSAINELLKGLGEGGITDIQYVSTSTPKPFPVTPATKLNRLECEPESVPFTRERS